MLTGSSPFAALPEGSGDEAAGDEATQAAVLKHEGGVPASVAADALPAGAAQLVAALLHPQAAQRLGAQAQGGMPAVKAHAWLALTRWPRNRPSHPAHSSPRGRPPRLRPARLLRAAFPLRHQ